MNGRESMSFLPQLDKPNNIGTKNLKEGLEKASENQDNMSWISFLAFSIPTGGSPFWLNDNSPASSANYRSTTVFFNLKKVKSLVNLINKGISCD
ncbi:MAG: hypothetical protein HY787_23565 [Deltaproteobacteria bacterium]|nr:hypothetical protein [Deltaproteobacteria bacterium]